MDPNQLAEEADRLAQLAQAHALHAHELAGGIAPIGHAVAPFVFLFTIFVIAVFVGYYVVWNVTPALHSPLMALTNGISSVIIVGAMLATGLAASGVARGFGTLAVLLVSVNIFGGFLVTQRMLQMFRRKSALAAGAPAGWKLPELKLPRFLSR
ncbi:MAG: NAD(P) transhydrogenase subunit alpha [Alphaproteobacteria bacterium]|nr:NAD(P) transhydrogenase subunit alpha [Alphaproteobacteria bacterium]